MRSLLFRFLSCIIFIFSSFEGAFAVDDPALCTESFEVERRCNENSPEVLSHLIAGSTNPAEALANAVDYWSQEGQAGILIAAELKRLLGTAIQSDFYYTPSATAAENIDRNRLTNLCVLQAGQLCKAQAKNPSLVHTDVEVCASGECQSVSPSCNPPIITGEAAEFALMRLLKSTASLVAETAICEEEQCSDFLSLLSQSGAQDSLRQNPGNAEEAAALCLGLTSLYPWQDERNQSSGGKDQAYNCRDASQGFIACMRRLGYGQGDVFRIHVQCQGCSSGSLHKHSLNMYRRSDGLICAVEPQKAMDQSPNVDYYEDCCYPSAQDAAACAQLRWCGRRSFEFMCCQPLGSPTVYEADQCPKEGSYCQDKDGNYTCPPDPTKCIPRKEPTPDDCEQKMRWCHESTPKGQPVTEVCARCNRCKICPSVWNCLFSNQH